MNQRSLLVALVALVTCVAAATMLHSRVAPPAAGRTEKNPAAELEKLRASCDTLARQNELLAGHITKLRHEHESIRDAHKSKLDALSKDVTANKSDAEKGFANLRKHFEDQNLRIEWKWFGGKAATDENGATFVANFDKDVIEATAVVNHANLSYGRDDHHVQRIFIAANVEKIDKKAVTVRYRALLRDDGRSRGGPGVEVLVFARVR